MGNRNGRSTRRDFLKSAALGTAAVSLSPLRGSGPAQSASGGSGSFQLKYAPRLGVVGGHAGGLPGWEPGPRGRRGFGLAGPAKRRHGYGRRPHGRGLEETSPR